MGGSPDVTRRMNVTDARANFSDVIGGVYYTNEPVIVERKGREMAVVISPDQYRRFQEQTKERFFNAVDQVQRRNEDQEPDDVDRFVTAIVEEVRQEHFEREQAQNADQGSS